MNTKPRAKSNMAHYHARAKTGALRITLLFGSVFIAFVMILIPTLYARGGLQTERSFGQNFQNATLESSPLKTRNWPS